MYNTFTSCGLKVTSNNKFIQNLTLTDTNELMHSCKKGIDNLYKAVMKLKKNLGKEVLLNHIDDNIYLIEFKKTILKVELI